jgi:hypothetical protein
VCDNLVRDGGMKNLSVREEIPAKDADPDGCWCVVGVRSLAGM